MFTTGTGFGDVALHSTVMPMFVLGVTEIILILGVTLLIFGAKRLPELGKSLGKGIKEFKSEVKDPAAPEQTPQEVQSKQNDRHD